MPPSRARAQAVASPVALGLEPESARTHAGELATLVAARKLTTANGLSSRCICSTASSSSSG
eukprot:3035190-Pleurochrysis_carterae.AAC.3